MRGWKGGKGIVAHLRGCNEADQNKNLPHWEATLPLPPLIRVCPHPHPCCCYSSLTSPHSLLAFLPLDGDGPGTSACALSFVDAVAPDMDDEERAGEEDDPIAVAPAAADPK
jgi:hypothetical protein